MNVTIQHCINTAETAILYSLIACGFYFTSIATRHFCFAAAASFVIAPFWALSVPPGFTRVPLSLFGLILCGIIGLSYQRSSIWLSSRGSREGQLLIFSLATMAIAENAMAMFWGSSSQTLWLDGGSPWRVAPGVTIVPQQLVVLVIGTALLALMLVGWRAALIGKVVQALTESRLNLSLRGIPIQSIELILASAGFACLGISGLLWSLDGRVKPAMCTEVAVVGAVTFIVGTTRGGGLLGVVLAAAGLAVIKLALSLTLEGDWSLTAMLLLLGVALFIRGQGALRVDSTI